MTSAKGKTSISRQVFGCLLVLAVVAVGMILLIYWPIYQSGREQRRESQTKYSEWLEQRGQGKGPVYWDNIAFSIGMKFVPIPAGTFMMGSPANEPGRFDNEGLQHPVTLRRSYSMQTTEVTQGQWKAIMGHNPSRFRDCGDDCPVENVSWDDAQKFISRLNAMAGTEKYRMPTEAEWEYACRAGTTTAIYSGEMPIVGEQSALALDPIAWYGGNSCVQYRGDDCSKWKGKQYKCSKCGTHPVGRKQPNTWGLYDMLGNVSEWCQDRYGGYESGSVTSPVGPGSGTGRVLRGGSWAYFARHCRSAYRSSYAPDYGDRYFGFRLVADLK